MHQAISGTSDGASLINGPKELSLMQDDARIVREAQIYIGLDNFILIP